MSDRSFDLRLGSLPRPAPLSPRRATVTAALDIGSSKICCLIARLAPLGAQDAFSCRTHAMQIIGFGLHRAEGVRSGVVVDLDAAEQAIRLAVDAAEREAGVTVGSAVVNVSCGRLQSDAFSASVPLAGRVAEADVDRALAAGASHSARPGRAVLHTLPIGFALDGDRRIRDPHGMCGEQLRVDLLVATVETQPVRNLILCVERCRLAVEALVATPYAAALACLLDEESDLGAALVEMGGGTTTISVFFEGRLIHTDAVAVGGRHVTLDVARGLGLRASTAERLKSLHATALGGAFAPLAMGSALDEEEIEGLSNSAREEMNRIVRARLEEIFELVRTRLETSRAAGPAARRVVLTGGACQLPGTAELARRIFNRPVRLGRPLGVSGLPETARGPAFAAAAGLLVYRQVAHLERVRNPSARRSQGGYLARVGRWIRESF